VIVSDPPSPGFIDFLRVNESVWGNEGRKNCHILVELIHNNAAALCLNLISCAIPWGVFRRRIAWIHCASIYEVPGTDAAGHST